MICGIDEAGRGPVLGDLVIAGVACNEENEEYMRGIGVQDSKKVSSRVRERLYKVITSKFEYCLIKITPQELDRSNINLLEAMKFAEVINTLMPNVAYVDCADVAPSNFFKNLSKYLFHSCSLVIEHKADEKYPVVSAASIVAKVERDRIIEKLKEEYGDIGSGYPSDPKTVAFLERWLKEYGTPPPFARKKWRTLSKLSNSSLLDFL
jgi:ribonuclease HII